MLMAQARVIYFEKASKAVEYFKTIGYSCPELSTPPDYFMYIMSIESIDMEQKDNYKNSDWSDER